MCVLTVCIYVCIPGTHTYACIHSGTDILSVRYIYSKEGGGRVVAVSIKHLKVGENKQLEETHRKPNLKSQTSQ